jgi:hypothetical protein
MSRGRVTLLPYIALLIAGGPLVALMGVWLWIVGVGLIPNPDAADLRARGLYWLSLLTIGAGAAVVVDVLLAPFMVGERSGATPAERRRIASRAALFALGTATAAIAWQALGRSG